MLDLPSNKTIGLGSECTQASAGAEMYDLPTLDGAGILVWIADHTSTNGLRCRSTLTLIHQSLTVFGLTFAIIHLLQRMFRRHSLRQFVVFCDDLFEIEPDQLTVADYRSAIDNGQIHTLHIAQH